MSSHLVLNYADKKRDVANIEYDIVNSVRINNRDVQELPVAFGPNDSDFLKRTQFTLDGSMRGIVEFIAEKRGTTLSGAFQAALNFIYHVVYTGAQSSGMHIERDNGTSDEITITTLYRYIFHIQSNAVSSGKYQISLDANQKEILDDLQVRLGLNSISDVIRQALMTFFGVVSMLRDGDKIVIRDKEHDYTVDV